MWSRIHSTVFQKKSLCSWFCNPGKVTFCIGEDVAIHRDDIQVRFTNSQVDRSPGASSILKAHFFGCIDFLSRSCQSHRENQSGVISNSIRTQRYCVSRLLPNPIFILSNTDPMNSYQFAQVGNDLKARAFLKEIDSHPSTGGLVDCTSNYENEADDMAKANPPVSFRFLLLFRPVRLIQHPPLLLEEIDRSRERNTAHVILLLNRDSLLHHLLHYPFPHPLRIWQQRRRDSYHVVDSDFSRNSRKQREVKIFHERPPIASACTELLTDISEYALTSRIPFFVKIREIAFCCR